VPTRAIICGGTYLLKRPVDRLPPKVRRFYADFSYQAQSYKRPRRVIGAESTVVDERFFDIGKGAWHTAVAARARVLALGE
jgi:hypothetical protein